MKANQFALLAGIALLGGAAIFGIPNSVWWDNGGWLPRVLLGLGVASWIYVIYRMIKAM